jgi:exodeoxyribonuclease VII large subunit
MPTKTEPLKPNSESASRKTQHIYTVSELTQDIKLILESSFDYVWVEGEVSNFSKHNSGHFYFSLKDGVNVLAAAMFSWANKNIKFKIENGLKVICFGKVGAYGPRSQYQIIVEKIEPKGVGSLQLALEQLKIKLEKEGLFDVARKRELPSLPSCIGIVTSPTGAAIKDMLRVIDRRFRDVHIILNPVRVQGQGAKEEIAQAIKELNSFNEQCAAAEKIEVIIVGRGGGSIEDLWAFNEEIVARAIYNSRIPVISAVGHERDTTIADLVADLRAATPSVAAELVLPKKEDLKQNIGDCIDRLNVNIYHNLDAARNLLNSQYERLKLLNPVTRILDYFKNLDDLTQRCAIALKNLMHLKTKEFQGAIGKLEVLSPLAILSRGYSITFKLPEERIVKEAKSLKKGDSIKSRVHKGEIISRVEEIK